MLSMPLKNSGLCWVLAGLLIGGIGRVARSKDPPAVAPPSVNPNVVVLRAEKRITIEDPSLSPAAFASACARQTGYSFSVDKIYAGDGPKYACLLRDVPMSSALAAIGYVTGGKWEKTGRSYHLRPLTPEEAARDAGRFEAIVAKMEASLAGVDPNDSTLPVLAGDNLSQFLRDGESRDVLAPLPEEYMADWVVSSRPGGITVSYQQTEVSGASRKRRGRSKYIGWKAE